MNERSITRISTWAAGALIAVAALIGCSSNDNSSDDDDGGGPAAASASGSCTPGSCEVDINGQNASCTGHCAEGGNPSGTQGTYDGTGATCTCGDCVDSGFGFKVGTCSL